MAHSLRLLCCVVIFLATVCLPINLRAQEAEVPAAAATDTDDGSVPGLTKDDVVKAGESVKADTELTDEDKAAAEAKYSAVNQILDDVAKLNKETAALKSSLQTAPSADEKNKGKLADLPTVEQARKVKAQGNSDDLRRELDAKQASLQGMVDELERVNGQLLKTEGRPVEIGTRLPIAQRELSELKTEWESMADVKTATEIAERMHVRARCLLLAAEIEMMEQEQLSQSVREQELTSRRDLLARQVENAKASTEALAAKLQQKLIGDVDYLRSLADDAAKDLPGDQAVQDLATEVQMLAESFQSVVQNQNALGPAMREVDERLQEVESEYRSVRNELSLGTGGRELAQVLLELARGARPTALKQSVPVTLERARLDWFSIKKKNRNQTRIEKNFAESNSQAVDRLVTTRKEILTRLMSESSTLTQDLAELQTQRQRYFDLCDEVQKYVSESLFGFRTRSCPAVSWRTLAGIPGGLIWLLKPEHLQEVSSAIQARGLIALPIVIGVILLLLSRFQLVDRLKETGPPIRRTSSDRYQWTLKALLYTVLLAAPIPILVVLVAWIFNSAANPSEWMIGLSKGWTDVIAITAFTSLMLQVARPDGLGIAHFRWDEQKTADIASALRTIAIVYIPSMIVISSFIFGEASEYYASLGRTIFLAAHAFVLIVLWHLLRTTKPFKNALFRKNSDDEENKSQLLLFWRSIRLPFLIITSLALIGLAWVGYLITAMDLSLGLCESAGLVGLAYVVQFLAIRWFQMRQRKIALAEAIERRRARLAAESESHSEQASEEVLQLDEETELGLDLRVAESQSEIFVRLFFNLTIVVVLYSYWSTVIPLAATLDTIPVPLTGGLSCLTLAKASLAVMFTYVATRNLPGFLEFAVFRTGSIEAGTRNAIYTLCQYATIGLGIIALSNILSLDWAKFGWMAAALSVGLGFGLQEIVANFVSGLIVLFERPIRVGDVVTIEGTTGTVTNINMRATTITNWDRQEFVVPNKNLITGTILNWTLSAPLNRIVIPVGVAYGTDTDLARRILMDVVTEHPNVLDDPKPSANFEAFADSSLTLILRAYLPNLDNRMSTITEVYTEISRRFEEAGIEIPFPQQDLHVRGDGSDLPFGGSVSEASK